MRHEIFAKIFDLIRPRECELFAAQAPGADPRPTRVQALAELTSEIIEFCDDCALDFSEVLERAKQLTETGANNGN